MEFLSTQQAAEKLGINASGVRRLILSGKLPATKVGRDHLIKESDLTLVANRKIGRPKKTEEKATTKTAAPPKPPPHPPFPTKNESSVPAKAAADVVKTKAETNNRADKRVKK